MLEPSQRLEGMREGSGAPAVSEPWRSSRARLPCTGLRIQRPTASIIASCLPFSRPCRTVRCFPRRRHRVATTVAPRTAAVSTPCSASILRPAAFPMFPIVACHPGALECMSHQGDGSLLPTRTCDGLPLGVGDGVYLGFLLPVFDEALHPGYLGIPRGCAHNPAHACKLTPGNTVALGSMQATPEEERRGYVRCVPPAKQMRLAAVFRSFHVAPGASFRNRRGCPPGLAQPALR